MSETLLRIDFTAVDAEITRLRQRAERAERILAALRADSESLSSRLRDCTYDRDGWKRRAERFERKIATLQEESTRVVAERDRAERILAALREPSEIITDALFAEYWDTAHPANALRAAVKAAEQEVGRE